jgi:hypothetical protein
VDKADGGSEIPGRILPADTSWFPFLTHKADLHIFNPQKRFLINELAIPETEVRFDKKNMAPNIDHYSHRRIFDSIFCGKTEGIKSDAAE